MKKALSIILLSIILLSAFAFPISAETTSEPTYTATYKSDKTVTVDGVMNGAEGYGSKPVAYFDQTFGNTDDTSSTKRGEVYMSYDNDNVYIFIKIYPEYNTVVDSLYRQIFVKANYGTVGSTDIGAWGTGKTVRDNFSSKNWTAAGDKDFKGYIKNNNSDSSYTAEIRMAIPEASRADLYASGLKVRLAISQGLGGTNDASYWGTSLGSAAKVSAESNARDAVNNGDEITLPAISGSGETTTSEPTYTATYKSDKTVTVDGVMNGAEGYGSKPVAYLDQVFSNKTATDPVTRYGEVYVSYDADYIYVFMIVYAEYNTIVKQDNKKAFIGVTYSEAIGTQEVITWGTAPGGENGFRYSENKTDDASLDFTGVTKNIEGGDFTGELRLRLPTKAKSCLQEEDLTINLAIAQYLGGDNGEANWGISLGSASKAAGESDVRNKIGTDRKGDNIVLHQILGEDDSAFIGSQSRENPETEGTYDIRFVSAIADYTGYEAIGYDMTYGGASATVYCSTVYRSLMADDDTLLPETYGGQYFFAYTISGLEKGHTYEFKVTPFTKKAEAEKVSGTAYTVTVTVAANGEITTNYTKA